MAVKSPDANRQALQAMREILVAGDTNRLVAELTFAPWRGVSCIVTDHLKIRGRLDKKSLICLFHPVSCGVCQGQNCQFRAGDLFRLEFVITGGWNNMK